MKRPFKSFLATQFEEFILSRQASNQWSKTYYENLHYFDNHVVKNYPEAECLTKEMLS